MIFKFFHGRPLLLGMVLLITSLLGVIGYVKMPRNMYPDVERPQVTVITQLPGASALSVAQKLSRPIEQELYSLSHIRDVQSTNKNEASIVRAEFNYEKGLDAALLDVNNALSRVRGKLPPDAPVSSVYAVGGFTQPVMVLAVTPKAGSSLSLTQVRLLAENDIRSALVTRPNIANVEVFGGYEPALRVEFDPLKLARYRITQAQLQELLGKLDRDWPVGTLQGKDGSMTVTVYGERASPEALRLMPLAGGLTLGDVAELRLSSAERFSAYHGNGKAAIAVAVLRAPGGAVQATIDDIEAQLPALKARYPNLEFSVADTQGELIADSNNNMQEALRDAIIFTSIVILFFLGNWRAVATALISIPLVFLSTVAILWLFGKEMNILVMTGIILALGMLVDDAVVVLENIERHLGELHEDVQTAIRRGTEEVLFPVFIGTLATAAVISPLMFVGDFSQQIFKHLVLAVVIAVFTSYFVAVTFIPRLSAFWYRNGLQPKNRLERWMEGLYQKLVAPGAGLYAGGLRFAFHGGFPRRLILVIPAFMLLAFSFKTIIPLIGKDALPPMDTGIVRVHVKFGANEPVASAEARLAAFEARLMQDKRVKRVSATFGSEAGVISLGSGQLPAEATINITYVNRLEREQSSWQIEADLRRQLAALPGVTIADAFDSGATALSTIKAPVDIRLYAEDWRLLPAAGEKVKAALQGVQGLSSVSVSWDANTAETHLVLNEERLRALGIAPDAVLAQLPLKGLPVASLSKLPSVSAIPVRSYFAEPYRSDPGTLALLPILLPDGSTVALGEISSFRQQPGLALLTGNGLRYSLDVLAYRNTAPISKLSESSLAAAQKVLPPGVEAADMGDNAAAADSSKRMVMGLGLGILLLFGVLVPAYGSVTLALLSILILPLSAIGAVWGLLAFNKALALPAILGIVLLFSIIIKNSILMVDFIQERRREGHSPFDAALGSIKLRYRPILMTAFGTIAGMIPIAMQRAVGLERLSPLADAAIGGLLLGTVLSLFYLPMFYVWVSGGRKA
ncbi:multidrug ABC transporter [Sulfurimicrobium lacus]|uniref:Multidrug ABC transporter n=1 Tax=Sulfurimicrobium lacus TaxID=2715678 RepID=A0A6F8VBW0_9PROT|nr:efflux RND transporter permease subunit [Sulfurimicrobium lacus]BCB26496.1 multidrug ABC transporter [Sulfurimicrobium lacus]